MLCFVLFRLVPFTVTKMFNIFVSLAKVNPLKFVRIC